MVTDVRDIYRYKETAWTIFIWMLKLKKKKKIGKTILSFQVQIWVENSGVTVLES